MCGNTERLKIRIHLPHERIEQLDSSQQLPEGLREKHTGTHLCQEHYQPRVVIINNKNNIILLKL